ncbi:hypothetical protein DRJ22_00500 [Candidatus Woesearchaeota archaeon]|nr:MAG: hypothetical protein B6U93_00155 [Candidatus Woesearchaeota archaeon ex4484_78]RLE46972.1 MAG: hypothetical protein DRJ22_00500 [Candidatus Woesearchaeota archaeon]
MENKRIFLASTVVLVLIIMLFFHQPSITGYVPTSTYSENINLKVDHSQEILIKSANQKDLPITSLLLSGEITGDGLVNVYLKDKNKHKLLVFTNKQKKGSSLEIITGLATKEINVMPGKPINKIETLPDGYEAVQGVFVNKCVETCSLNPKTFNANNLVLEVIIEPGTILHITGIKFSLEQNL